MDDKDKNLKICIINANIHSLFFQNSLAPIGGTEVQLFLLSQYLKDKYNISVITGDWGQPKIQTKYGVNIYKSFKLKRCITEYLLSPFKLFLKLYEIRADIHIMSSESPEVGIVSLYCFITRTKLIYRTANDLEPRPSKSSFFRKLFLFGLRRANVVITQNKFGYLQLQKNHSIKSTIIYNGFQIPKINTINKISILWVSRCIPSKNPEMALNIASKFPNKNFVLICTPQLDYLKLFNKVKKQANKLPNVTFINKVPFSKIDKYYKKAIIFMGTSEIEGFPNTYLQASIYGTPIVSYKVNPDEFITKNKLGYIADGNIDEMINKISYLLKHPAKWKTMSQNCQKYVRRKHDIEKIGVQWNKIIKSLKSNF